MAKGSKLIVGLGNPGERYRHTRHNLGAMVVEAYAEKIKAPFKKKILLSGSLASGEVGGEKIYSLLPTTYMNLSGAAVSKTLHWYRLALEDLIVIVDDVDLPFGKMRYREKGSSGGHNGLKDIERVLGTQHFARLKMGIGPEKGRREPLDEFVLSAFSPEEREQLASFIQAGVRALESWVQGGSIGAIEKDKIRSEQKGSGENVNEER